MKSLDTLIKEYETEYGVSRVNISEKGWALLNRMDACRMALDAKGFFNNPFSGVYADAQFFCRLLDQVLFETMCPDKAFALGVHVVSRLGNLPSPDPVAIMTYVTEFRGANAKQFSPC